MSEWQPIETAPRDGTDFLALQDGEVWRAQYRKGPNGPYLVRRTHERQQSRSYRVLPLEIDGVWAERRVLMHEDPDDYGFNWVIWSRGYEFAPTHWTPLPPPPTPSRKENTDGR